MTSAKDKAEAYVRQQLPELKELSFGCEIRSNHSGCRAYFTGRNQEKDETYYIDQDQIGTEDEPFAMEGESRRTIIGHPIQLQHWLRVINMAGSVYMEWHGGDYFVISVCDDGIKDTEIKLNLTTGQPATEADYQAFCNIVGV